MTPTVSIVIPCYNAEQTIGQTLRSLQAQTFNAWDAVVVVDGASDRSAQIVQQFGLQDCRIRMIEQDNKGLAAARNAGISNVSGEFLCFLDADDVFLPAMLETLVGRLCRSPYFGAMYCGWFYGDAELRERDGVVPACCGQLFQQLSHRNLFPCHSVILRHQLLGAVGLFDGTLKHCHDWDLWARLARTGLYFGCIPQPLVIYRMVPGSLSRSPRSFFASGKEIIRRTHLPDPRVLHPAPEFANGCSCGAGRPLADWAVVCAGHALSVGDHEAAHDFFAEIEKLQGVPPSPGQAAAVVSSLWFGTGVAHGSWRRLWTRVGGSLLRFLAEQEERLHCAGFAMETLEEILRQSRTHRRTRVLTALKRFVGARAGVWRCRLSAARSRPATSPGMGCSVACEGKS